MADVRALLCRDRFQMDGLALIYILANAAAAQCDVVTACLLLPALFRWNVAPAIAAGGGSSATGWLQRV